MCKVPSLKQLAAEVVPHNTLLAGLPNDLVSIIKYNKSEVKMCKHETTWTYRRNKVNGLVTYFCGCVEEWKNDEYVKVVVDCDSMMRGVCLRIWGWSRGCESCVMRSEHNV